MTPEGRVKKKIVDYLETVPNLIYELRQAGGWAYKKGKPDLWFVYNGRHFEIEVKAPGGQPSSLQIFNEMKFLNAGSYYWRGESAENFIEWFETICPDSRFLTQ